VTGSRPPRTLQLSGISNCSVDREQDASPRWPDIEAEDRLPSSRDIDAREASLTTLPIRIVIGADDARNSRRWSERARISRRYGLAAAARASAEAESQRREALAGEVEALRAVLGDLTTEISQAEGRLSNLSERIEVLEERRGSIEALTPRPEPDVIEQDGSRSPTATIVAPDEARSADTDSD
jgi:hypothetical protein